MVSWYHLDFLETDFWKNRKIRFPPDSMTTQWFCMKPHFSAWQLLAVVTLNMNIEDYRHMYINFQLHFLLAFAVMYDFTHTILHWDRTKARRRTRVKAVCLGWNGQIRIHSLFPVTWGLQKSSADFKKRFLRMLERLEPVPVRHFFFFQLGDCAQCIIIVDVNTNVGGSAGYSWTYSDRTEFGEVSSQRPKFQCTDNGFGVVGAAGAQDLTLECLDTGAWDVDPDSLTCKGTGMYCFIFIKAYCFFFF